MNIQGMPRIPGETEPQHIGDGVYASHDGYQIWLRTLRDDGGWSLIALDRYTLANLIQFERELTCLK